FFFFQAEDGIRDPLVTGVQTCALPISSRSSTGCARWAAISRRASTSPSPGRPTRSDAEANDLAAEEQRHVEVAVGADRGAERVRSEERRVGKECRARGAACQGKNTGDR